MTIVRSKICGITCVADASLAVEAGADAIGLVFYEKSPRVVTPEQARAIVAALPPFVTTVGLFVNAGREEIKDVLRSVPLDVLQFHGDETPQECEGHGRPYFKALRVRAEDNLLALTKTYANAQAILLDTYVPGLHGGTGERFDWSLIPEGLAKPLILAGGLTPHNVREAIAQVRPYAVDVSGGVEASKGRKDAAKVREFIRQVRLAETSM